MTNLTLRRWHAYIGLFTAPSVLFFALTGAIQIFNLHEAHGSYRPAALLEKLSAVHMDQVFEKPHEHAAHDDDAESGAVPADAMQHQHGDEGQQQADEEENVHAATLALKVFFLAVALALSLSSALGIWMGFTQIQRKAVAWTLVIAGAIIPICLIAL